MKTTLRTAASTAADNTFEIKTFPGHAFVNVTDGIRGKTAQTLLDIEQMTLLRDLLDGAIKEAEAERIAARETN